MKKLRNVGFEELLLGKGGISTALLHKNNGRARRSNSHIIFFLFSHTCEPLAAVVAARFTFSALIKRA
jgi:hypothetical protein